MHPCGLATPASDRNFRAIGKKEILDVVRQPAGSIALGQDSAKG